MVLSKSEKSLLRRKRKFLKNFAKLRKKDQISRLKTCSNEDIHTICECFYNLLSGSFNLDNKTKRKVKKVLDPIKRETRQLSNSNIDISKKRKVLSKPQVGRGIVTGLSTLISVILPAILSTMRK